MRKRVLLIFNPNSGTGKAREILPDAINYLYQNNCRVTVCPISRGHGAEEILAEESDNFDIVVCCGGDGTLNHAINGIMKMKEKPMLGYIPTGSTNDFAISMEIKDLYENCVAIATGQPFYYDIGKFNHKYFNYVAAFGAFTQISYATPQEIKNKLGHLAYVVEGLTHLPVGQFHHVKITTDDHIYEGDYVYGSVSNSTSIGGVSLEALRKSTLDDGLYEVILVKYPTNILDKQRLIASILIQDFDNPYIEHFKADKLKFEFTESTPWTLDGEFGDDVKVAEICVQDRAVGLLK